MLLSSGMGLDGCWALQDDFLDVSSLVWMFPAGRQQGRGVE